MTHEGSIDQQASSSSSLQSAVDQSTANGYNLSFSRKEDGDCESASGNGSSVKWMSSKVRLMKKMMNSNCSGVDDKPPKFTQRLQYPVHDSDETNSFSKANNTVRVCSDCNTTTTPLWRSGPRGPKVIKLYCNFLVVYTPYPYNLNKVVYVSSLFVLSLKGENVCSLFATLVGFGKGRQGEPWKQQRRRRLKMVQLQQQMHHL